MLNKLIEEYAHTVFGKVVGKPSEDSSVIKMKKTEIEQKNLFVNWFRGLTRNGKPYNPVTISGYTGRIENACCDSAFVSIPIKNLFSITDLDEFLGIQKRIKSCEGYAEFDARSHNGFTAALRKYEEFLRQQASGDSGQTSTVIQRPYVRSSNVHRWTMEEDAICCKRFLEYYVLQGSNLDTIQFLQMLAKEVPDVSEGSLRMKIQNIKYLVEREGIENTSTLKWLSQYSVQCEKAFYQALRELNIR